MAIISIFILNIYIYLISNIVAFVGATGGSIVIDNVSVQAVNEGTKQVENTSRTVKIYERRKSRKVTDESRKSQIREERTAGHSAY